MQKLLVRTRQRGRGNLDGNPMNPLPREVTTMLRSKILRPTLLLAASIACTLLGSPLAQAEPWQACGTLQNIDPTTCTIPERPLTAYEYGIAYNTFEPLPVVCTTWNTGVRIANKAPYLVESDDPSLGMRYGGFVFYQNTYAADDDECANRGGYRHWYWRFTTDNVVERTFGSNGCFDTNQTVYCRSQ